MNTTNLYTNFSVSKNGFSTFLFIYLMKIMSFFSDFSFIAQFFI